jgi:uncharacterized protein
MTYERKIARSMYPAHRLSCVLEMKSLSETGVFAGYGSVFDRVDSQRDVVVRGAFAATLDKRRPSDVKLLWQHDVLEPIGVIEELFEDDIGLYVKGRLLLDVARAREAYALLKEGVVKGLSIGYSPLRYSIDPDSGVRMLKAVELWEISLVTFPANDAAQITVFKDHAPDRLSYMQENIPAWQAVKLSDALDKAIYHLLM